MVASELNASTHVLFPSLLGVAQAVEHYEMLRYRTLNTWTGELGMGGAIKFLDSTGAGAIQRHDEFAGLGST